MLTTLPKTHDRTAIQKVTFNLRRTQSSRDTQNDANFSNPTNFQNEVRSFAQQFNQFQFLRLKGKGKAIPLQTWTGPEGSRRLRLPDFKTISTERWPPLPPGNIPGTHFC